jgi:multiple sugar transport system permease protein
MGKDWIVVSLIIVSVWQFFPFVVIGVLARLQTIPEELTTRPRLMAPIPGNASFM